MPYIDSETSFEYNSSNDLTCLDEEMHESKKLSPLETAILVYFTQLDAIGYFDQNNLSNLPDYVGLKDDNKDDEAKQICVEITDIISSIPSLNVGYKRRSDIYNALYNRFHSILLDNKILKPTFSRYE